MITDRGIIKMFVFISAYGRNQFAYWLTFGCPSWWTYGVAWL